MKFIGIAIGEDLDFLEHIVEGTTVNAGVLINGQYFPKKIEGIIDSYFDWYSVIEETTVGDLLEKDLSKVSVFAFGRPQWHRFDAVGIRSDFPGLIQDSKYKETYYFWHQLPATWLELTPPTRYTGTDDHEQKSVLMRLCPDLSTKAFLISFHI